MINNTLYECYRGVLADSAFSSTFVNNDVYNNVLGIVLESSSHNCSLTNNTVIGNNNAGIWLCESDECNLTDNTICGNLKIGVDFGVSCDCIFTFNQVQGNLKTGIYIDANSNRNTFYGNSFGWNLGGNAQDHGSDNIWDDGISMGNAWGDYNGTGSVSIPGSAGSIDHFPFKADTDLPTCNEPDNFWFDVGTTDNIVIWTPYDDHPKSYLVLRNGTYFNSGAWNGSSITVSVDDLSYGTHNLTLVVYDTCYNSVSDTVLVTVTDTCAPLCNDPSDMQISEGSIGFTITWTPWDATPSSYSVLRNGTEIDSGVWDGSEIVVSLDGLSLGVYNYTLSLSDLNGNSVRNTVIITVFDATPPTIDSPIDIIYEVGVTGNVIVWHPFDLHPASYSILRNGSIVRSGGWDGSAITIAVDGLVTGSYNFTVMVIDAQGNWVVDMVFVIVIATPLTPMTVVIAVGGVGLIAFLVLVSVIKMKRKPKVVLPAIGLERAVETKVRTLRGCEIVGGKFEYKVKVQNNSYWVITNVSVVIAAYPDDCLQLVGSTMKRIPRIEPDGFRSPQFTFKPTKDCVEGQILATVTYVDHENRTNMIEVEPYVIRSVCDLLKPLESTLEEFDLILRDMTATKEQRTVDWNSEVLFKKVKVLLPAKNFEIIDMNEHTTDNIFTGTINGLAMGKYTSKRVAVKITISGIVDENKANVQIEGLGDDEAMLPTTIHEIAEGIQSWVCLNCAAPLDLIEVDQLQSRELVRCRYCNHTMSIDLYRKRST
nr:MAG: hypothetical protein AM325_16655 [Candidatus Thorarchaeota archaeon SMTZ1-45]